MLWAMTVTETRNLGYGVAGSLALHVLLFVVLAVWMGLEPVRRIMESVPEPVVTMVFAENVISPEPEAPPPQEAPRYVRTTQNEEAPAPPAKADFISDRNTVAAAKLPSAGGEAPAPTTKGVDIPAMELANRDYKDGAIKDDSALNPPPSPARPDPGAPGSKSGGERLPLEVSRPGSTADAAAMLKSPEEDEKDVPPLKAIPIVHPPAPPAPPADTPPRPQKDAFQPQTRVAEVKGTISNLGDEDSVNAVATPEGRYIRQVHAAIARRWHANMRARADLVNPGRIRVYFSISKDGKPEKIEFLSDKRDLMLQDVTLTSILEAQLPPVPEEVLARMVGEHFPMQFNVVYY